uniref:WD domain protein n=1 Tax=Musca domestica TaxID=7370 RepID=A0A1I8ML61_MUSDO
MDPAMVTKLSRTEATGTSRSTTKPATTVKRSTDEKEKLRTAKTTLSKTNEIRKSVAVKPPSNERSTGRTTTSKAATTKPLATKSQIKAPNTTATSTKTNSRVTANQPQQPQQQQRRVTKVSKSPSVLGSPVTTPRQPLRAKHTPEIKEAVKRNAIAKTSSAATVPPKPNAVLDTHSNVTIASPPPKRKNEVQKPQEEVHEEELSKPSKLTRKGSRVLAPDEIVVLKRESAKKRSEEQIRRDSVVQLEPRPVVAPKEPVAFEVPFNERQKTEEETEINYSDDFDSYESDFETGSSRKSSGPSSVSNTASDEDEEEGEEETTSLNETSSEEEECSGDKILDSEEEEEDSEITQDPITVLQRDKERKLDSGHYELNSRRNPKLADIPNQSTQNLVDSFETFSLNASDQLDSGISAYGPSTLTNISKGNFQIFYGGYKDFLRKPIHNKRGEDLMAKIQLDTLEFQLFDMKPISYDVFMQTFGKLNTYQSSTQTQDNLMSTESQTDNWEMRSMWTQHPAQYDWEMVKQLTTNVKGSILGGGVLGQNCCGELEDENDIKTSSQDELERSLEALKLWENQKSLRKFQNQGRILRKPIDYEGLNSFLLRSSMVINQILGSTLRENHSDSDAQQLGHLERIVDSRHELDSNFLNTLRVVRIFSNSKHNLVITVHESLPETDVYKSDFAQLLMVWCVNVNDKPNRLLSTWSQVSRVEISNDSADIVVASLRDGSVAMWDLRETYSFCSKLDGYLTHFAATQSIVPSFEGVQDRGEILMDYGSCLDVRSFKTANNNWALANVNGSRTKSQ